jgi:hypothetical protein
MFHSLPLNPPLDEGPGNLLCLSDISKVQVSHCLVLYTLEFIDSLYTNVRCDYVNKLARENIKHAED